MLTLHKKAPFQTEVAIAILAFVMVMAIMNFAANRTLSRVTNDLRESNRERLTSVALRISAEIESDTTKNATSVILSALVTRDDVDYALILDSNLTEVASYPSVFSRNARVNIHALLFDSEERGTLGNNKYQFSYKRNAESEWELYHCPVVSAGEWRVLALAKRTVPLAAVERDARYLLIGGAVIVLLMTLAVFAFFRGVTSPFKRIKESVAEVGASSPDAESAVDELVSKYKQTIEKLRSKETRLLELNQQLEGRIGDIERFNDSLLGAITTGVVVLDSQGRLIGVNDKARTFLECHSPIQLGKTLQKNNNDDYVGMFYDYPKIKLQVERVLLNPTCEINDFEFEQKSPDGSINTFRVSLMPLIEADSSLRELMLLISDQTEVVRAQRRLEDSRQLATIGEMSAGLAHQLRNSISAAMGFSSLVKRRAEKSDFQGSVESIDSLLKELNDEAALVDRFLSFAKPLALATEPTQVEDFLADVLAGYQLNPKTDSRVQLNIQTNGEAELDTLLLKQVIVNLVDNALRASESHNSPVDITANVSADEVIFVISDYGCGISESEQLKIFTPFYSGSPSGVGLGLPLARKIIELHGGVLELVSRPDCGATFTIQLPRYQESTSERAVSNPNSLPSRA